MVAALPRLHLVTDRTLIGQDDFPRRAAVLLDAGGDRIALHLRGPGAPGRLVHELALALRGRAAASGALLLVNDRVDVAAAAHLDGVHLGQRSLFPVEAREVLRAAGAQRRSGKTTSGGSEPTAEPWIGLSVHAPGEVRPEADYLMVGPIFETPSHPGRPGAGHGIVQEIGETLAQPLPLVAIGGIGPERVAAVLAAGAWGVAVLSGVWGAASPVAAMLSYLEALERSRGAGKVLR